MMTVEQLRQKLRGANPKAVVAVSDHDGGDFDINGFVRSVKLIRIEDTNLEGGGWGFSGPAVVLQL